MSTTGVLAIPGGEERLWLVGFLWDPTSEQAVQGYPAAVRSTSLQVSLLGRFSSLTPLEVGMSAHLERMLRRSGQEIPVQKRVLELNPDHPLVGGLQRLHGVDTSSPRIGEYAELLLGQALIAEGSPLPDPARFSKLLSDLMVDAVSE